MNNIGLGNRIRTARKEQHLTSEALSELCERSSVFIRQIESGTRLPSVPSLVAICNKLDVSADYLLADSLTKKSNDRIKTVYERLKMLSPKQAELAAAVIDTIIDNFEEPK